MGAFIGVIGVIGILVGITLVIIGRIKKKNYEGKIVLLVFLAIFVIALIITPADQETKPDSSEESVTATATSTSDNKTDESDNEVVEEEPIEIEPTPQEKMVQKIIDLINYGKAFDAGNYTKGDIPVGEYAYIPFSGSGQYHGEKDLAGNIIDNENFDSFGYVYVHDKGNIETGGALVSVKSFEELGVSSAIEIYEVVNDLTDYKDSGWYKVGVDIPAGQYVIESYGEAYVAVKSGPVGNSEIIDNENFNGKYTVNVTEGQYLVVSGGTITQ